MPGLLQTAVVQLLLLGHWPLLLQVIVPQTGAGPEHVELPPQEAPLQTAVLPLQLHDAFTGWLLPEQEPSHLIVSPVVQELLSLQAVPALTAQPLQLGAGPEHVELPPQEFPPHTAVLPLQLQDAFTGWLVPEQEPPEHTSPVVQALESLHETPLVLLMQLWVSVDVTLLQPPPLHTGEVTVRLWVPVVSQTSEKPPHAPQSPYVTVPQEVPLGLLE